MEILKNSLSSKILLLISVLFLLLITLSTINAAETNINSTDNLGQTIENASNGDIINLEAGIYTNNVTNILVNKSLTIQGKKSSDYNNKCTKFGKNIQHNKYWNINTNKYHID
ncbi:hypothetical protein [Methanobrevibacter arboriphilus]|uniref:hypothetical protein n=1 Tax=Methanobrevibacter arboriphilus TaxID=39441 RepID=UPI000B0D1C88|nr:hypothetical protein [Methanobrevibacter arboriphilus]